ncbi:MAG: pilus assembly protein N-terminal domain-containing protein [Sulfuricella sp.]
MIAYKNRALQFTNRWTAEKSATVSLALKAKLLAIFLVILLLGVNGESFGQTSPAAAAAIESTAAGGTFGEVIKPKTKYAATLQKRPYNPIRKQDDQAQIPEIEMFVGESRVFPAPGVARIAVGNGAIMSAAALDSKEVLIFANAIGTSSLFVWNEDGRYQRVKINIVPGDTSRFAREIAAFLTAIPNAKASVIGDKVIVEGDNLSDLDIAKIDELAKRYPQIVNFTNRLGWEQMVFMDVKVVEFPTNELRDIGLKWSALGGAVVGGIWQPIKRINDGPYQINVQTGTTNPTPITSPGGTGTIPLPASLNILSAVNLGLNAQLNLLAQNGKAAILAEPQLSARNGSKATFLAGGEYPYTVSTVNGPTVQFKSYGVKLDIIPRVDRNGVIRAIIESEVSTIDASVSTPSGPGLLTRKTNTEFNVRNGQTIVLSGLLSRENSTDIDKVPLLGDIPLLGALFRSSHFVNKETELVVFVTPTVVDAHSPGLVNRIERTTERLQQKLGNQPYLSNPLQPGHDPAKVDQEPPAAEQAAPASAPANTGKETPAPAPVVAITHAAPVRPATSDTLVPPSQNPLQAPTPPAPAPDVLQVKLDGLLLRAGPSLKSRVLLQLGYGSIVHAGPQGVQPPELGYWRNVIVGGIDGWVASNWITPLGTKPVRARSNSLVAQPDQQGQVIELGGNGSRDEVSKSSAPSMEPVTATSPATSAAGKRYRVNLERLALRVAPDINAAVIQKLASGAVVDALPQAPTGRWMAVQADGKRGWVAAQWLVPEQQAQD